MAELALGPILRFVDESDATVWVETDRPCEVGVLDHRARTFAVGGHHYALVRMGGLDAGRTYPYEVRLDGEVVWPDPHADLPAPAIRTRAGPDTSIAFGSCRVAAPSEAPWNLPPGRNSRGRGADALVAYAHRMLHLDAAEWPDLLLMLGDQVYADDASPETREFIRSRRDTSQPPGEEVADLEEYTRLYREAWSQPDLLRWVLASVPSAMIFDDHDIIDDWNISRSWQQDLRATDWWDERIVSGLVAYWLYQHLGNLAPSELDADPLWAEVRAAGDATGLLREVALQADREPSSFRWSFARPLGATRLVVVDSRAGRTFTADGGRDMLDETEWRWLESQVQADARHLVIATSLPVFLPRFLHHLEQWNDAVARGAWSPVWQRPAEAVRRLVDLEHWAAFPGSFARLTQLLHRVATAPDGPGSITVLSGDVHHGYLARVGWERSTRAPVWQVTASPMRNLVPGPARPVFGRSDRPAWAMAGRLLARLAGVDAPPVTWRLVDGPIFANHIGTLDLAGPAAELTLETPAHEAGDPTAGRLDVLVARTLAP